MWSKNGNHPLIHYEKRIPYHTSERGHGPHNTEVSCNKYLERMDSSNLHGVMPGANPKFSDQHMVQSLEKTKQVNPIPFFLNV